jgi:ribosomal protein S27E
MFRQVRCAMCYNRGIVRDKVTGRYFKCVCGRMLDSVSAGKMAKQDKLDRRLDSIKKEGWG